MELTAFSAGEGTNSSSFCPTRERKEPENWPRSFCNWRAGSKRSRERSLPQPGDRRTREDDTDLGTVLVRADEALYRAKEKGKSQVSD